MQTLNDLPKISAETEKFRQFLQEFESGSETGESILKYKKRLDDLKSGTSRVLEISLDDLKLYNSQLCDNVCRNTKQYLEIAYNCVDEINGFEPIVHPENPSDQLRNYRIAATESQPENDQLRRLLLRRYEIVFTPSSVTKGVPIRQIDSKDIGSYVSVTGMVTRVSVLKPLVKVATYICKTCGYEFSQEVTSTSFMPYHTCQSPVCKANNSNGDVIMNIKGFQWRKYQEVIIQELSSQLQPGYIPRILVVHCEGSTTQQCTPGNIVTISGIYLPIAYSGFRGLRAGLITDTYLSAMHIHHVNAQYKELSISKDIEEKMNTMEENENIYENLSRSIAPQIFGHLDIKKSLLLQMVGGVTRDMKDGISIRGEINICLMGDPGVAKSQLLKYISVIAPRSIYTTGKGSSSVGLTAAVVRDEQTGEVTLEGGALVLSDKGICCIDEFDKMDEYDRTAIHEVMEQQTISIAKAGIQTRLNARTSILAAANPLFGRYNTKKSPGENINLPAALLSRFDLLYLIIDRPDIESDLNLAQHITSVHRYNKPPKPEYEIYSTDFLKAYISKCREHNPFVPESLEDYIADVYATIRVQESQISSKTGDDNMMTARQLLSILRLAQAHARVFLRDVVTEEDVDEALRLLRMSKSSIADNDEDFFTTEDIFSRIYILIREEAVKRKTNTLKYSEIEPIIIRFGFNRDQLDQCIRIYMDMNIWQLSENKTSLTFTST